MEASVTMVNNVTKAAGNFIYMASRILNQSGRSGQATRHHVQKAVEQSGYLLNAIAHDLTTNHPFTLGLMHE